MGTVTPTRALRTIGASAIEEKITALHGRLAEVEGQPNRYCVPRDQAPSTLERQQLSAVSERLEERLKPCDDELVIEAIVSQFLIPYDTARDADPVTTQARNERYVNAVRGQPLGAIQAAVVRFDSASTILPAGPSFRPKPAEFAAEVKAGLTGIRTKLVHIRRILAAEVYDPPTPEQLEQVKQAAKAFLDSHAMPARPRAGQDARDMPALPELDTIRPLTGNISHLIDNLDRRRVRA